MRKVIVAISLGIIALGLCSCRRDATTPAEVKEDILERTVVFSVAGKDFAVKSTDGGFEDGDVIGIFAPEKEKINVKADVSGTGLVPDTPILWDKEQAANTDFYAYYPYKGEVNSPTYAFSVAEDQTVDDAFKAADLRTSHVSAAPRSTVAFVLGHRFSKITFTFSGLAGGEKITGVVLKDLFTKAVVDIGTGAPGGLSDKADISAHKRTDASFEAVLVPQSYLNMEVKTSSGRTLRYTTFTPFLLESGCAYQAELGVPASGEDTSAIGFTFSIVGWDDGGVISYGEPTNQEGL